MLDHLRSSLGELGLTQKEINVYLAMLEMGPATVQDIADKAGVNRTTTYLVIESLSSRGLISTVEKGKRALFMVENPERLMALVTHEMAQVLAKQDRLREYLPRLLALFQSKDSKPVVRFFEGEEALVMVRRELLEFSKPLWEAYAVDEETIRMANIHGKERIEHTKRLVGRSLMAIKSGVLPPFFDRRGVDVRIMDYERYPFSGSLSLIANRVYVLMHQRPMGIIIESQDMSQLFRALYEAAWQQAKHWNPPSDWGAKTI